MDGLGQRAHETGDLPDESGIFPLLVLGRLLRRGNAETHGDRQVGVFFDFEE